MKKQGIITFKVDEGLYEVIRISRTGPNSSGMHYCRHSGTSAPSATAPVFYPRIKNSTGTSLQQTTGYRPATSAKNDTWYV